MHRILFTSILLIACKIGFSSNYSENETVSNHLVSNISPVEKSDTRATCTVSFSSVETVNTTGCTVNNAGSICVTINVEISDEFELSINNGSTWTYGKKTVCIYELVAGDYDIVIRDKEGCSVSYSGNPVIISVENPLEIAEINTSAQTDGNLGKLVVRASGGEPFQYRIDGGTWQDSDTFYDLVAGTHQVDVKNNAECIVSEEATVADERCPVFSSSRTNNRNCFTPNGSITITATGVRPFSYSNDNGSTWQTDSVFSGLTSGTYQLAVKADNGCISTGSIIISKAYVQFSGSSSSLNVTGCMGDANGEIHCSAFGGDPPYRYLLNSGSTWKSYGDFTGLRAGTHTVVARDDYGCTDTTAFTITQPVHDTIDFVMVDNVEECAGDVTGKIAIDASLLSPPPLGATEGISTVEYSIDGGSTWQASKFFNGLTAGEYTAVVKVDGCEYPYFSNTVAILEPDPVQITSIDISADNGSNSGEITITASGGSNNFTYSNDGGSTFDFSETFTGLSAGSYNLVVQDDLGCNADSTVTVPDQSIEITNVESTNVTGCYDDETGTITITASGSSLTYSIDNGSSWQSSNEFSGLAAGSYNVKIKDATDNTKTWGSNPIVITEPTAMSFAASAYDPVCSNDSSGQVRFRSVTGGTGIKTYSVDGGASYVTSSSVAHLVAGTYNLQIKDENECIKTYALNPVTLSDPAPYQIKTLSKTDNTSCSETGNGTITVSASALSSLPPLGSTETVLQDYYSIDNGATWHESGTFINLKAGNYYVWAKNQDDCMAEYGSNPVTINNLNTVSIEMVNSVDIVHCDSVNSGSITVFKMGSDGYNYSIDNGATWQSDNDFTHLSSGNYYVVAKDSTGCEKNYSSNPVQIKDYQLTNIESVEVEGVSCYGATDGEIRVYCPEGGIVHPITGYSIDGGAHWQTRSIFENIAAGSYSILMKDDNNCTSEYSSNPVVIENPLPLTISEVYITGDDGSSNGEIEIVVSGKYDNLEFSIDGGDSFESSDYFENLPAGTYLIVARVSEECSADTTVTVPSTSIVISNVVSTNITGCYGNENGTITISASGGSGSLSYSIDNGASWQSSNTFSNLPAGSYTIKVKDSSENENGWASNPVMITQPSQLTITTVDASQPTCYGSLNGHLSITATGGTGTLQYSVNNGSSWQGSSEFSNLAPGSFTLVVKDENNCNANYSLNPVVLNNPTPVTISSVSIVSDNGSTNGQITITALGGTGELEYSINGGSSFISSNSFSSLPTGSYALVVRDEKECLADSTVMIPSSSISISGVVSTNITGCFGNTNGTITITASGGSGSLFYSINNGSSWQSSNTFSNLPAANYTIKVKDSDESGTAWSSNPVTLTQPSQLTITTVDALQPTCYGSLNGHLSITATGGTGTLQYSVNNGSSWQGSSEFINLAPGSFTMVVKDGNNCNANYSLNPVVLNNPTPVTISSVSIVSDNGSINGQITITASGGTGELEYSINGGSSFTSSNSFSSLPTGSYALVVRDEKECLADSTVMIPSSSISISGVVSTNITGCFGNTNGTITITASGGSGSLFYSINNGASWQSSNTFNNLPAANYTIKVKDNSENEKSWSSNPVILTQPTQIVISDIETTQPSCPESIDGEIIITASGGIGTLQFSVNNGSTWNGTPHFSSLEAGDYYVKIKDANGCITTYSGNPAILIDPIPPVINEVTIVQPVCPNDKGSIQIVASGEPEDIMYSIDQGTTWQTSAVFENLDPGSYDMQLKYGTDCWLSYIENPIVINNIAPLSLNVTSQNISCNGLSNGTINVTASGGSGIISFSIDNGLNWSNNGQFTGLPAGNYSVIIRDANGCELSHTSVITITEPEAISITGHSGNLQTTCEEPNSGSIIIDANRLLQYSINDGETWQDNYSFDNLSGGNYFLKIKNENGCEKSYDLNPVVIHSPSEITIANVKRTVISNCEDNQSGSITIEASGEGALEYSIDNGKTWSKNATFTSLPSGRYNIKARNETLCEAFYLQNPVIISSPKTIVISNIIQTNPLCSHQQNGTITVITSATIPGILYSIDNGINWQTSNVFNNLNPGEYRVIAKASGYCDAAWSLNPVRLENPKPIEIIQLDPIGNQCAGVNTGSITINAEGGTGQLLYSINNGKNWGSNNQFPMLKPGSYTVLLKDNSNCIKSFENNPVVLNDATPIQIISVISSDITSCSGNVDGKIAITATGGTGSLQYSVSNGEDWQAGSLFENLSSKEYQIKVKDKNGCQKSFNQNPVTISSPVKIEITNVTVSPIFDCYGSSTGMISIATSSDQTLNYSIDNGKSWQVSSKFNNLLAGNYFIKVTDSNGCEDSYDQNPVIITEPEELIITSVESINPLCNGYNDGSISILASGGTGSYNYSKDNGISWSAMNVLSKLSGGNYQIAVKDANNCKTVWKLNPLTITEPEPILIGAIETTKATCDGCKDGSIKVEISGGNSPYQISVDYENNWHSGNIAEGLPQGEYPLSVKDKNQCIKKLETGLILIEKEPVGKIVLNNRVITEFFPNPVNHLLNINVSGLDGELDIILHGADGRKFHGINSKRIAGSETFLLDLGTLKPGIYFITIYSNKQMIETQQIMKK